MYFQVLFKAALVILAGALGSAKVRKRAAGLCETLEVLRHPPESILGEDYLMYHMQRLNLTEEDFEFEHQRQTAKRRAMANRRLNMHILARLKVYCRLRVLSKTKRRLASIGLNKNYHVRG